MRIDRILGRIWVPLALIGGIFAVCVAGFILSEGVSVFNGIYWGVVTVSTIGYGDIVPTNTDAKIFAIILALSTVGVIGYGVSTVASMTAQAREEELLGLDGTRFEGHVLLFGWTPVAQAALRELLHTGRKIAIMSRHQGNLTDIRTFVAHALREARSDPQMPGKLSQEKDVFTALGDYSQGAALKLLNLPQASEAIVASDDDARNVMTALLLRQLAPQLRVVVAVMREELRETLHAAGVTYVISPSELGGRMVAAAALQPEVAQAFDDLTTTTFHYEVDQFPLVPPNPLLGEDFDAAQRRLRAETGATLIGLARPAPPGEGRPPFEVVLSPPPGTFLESGWYALILSDSLHTEALRAWVQVPPGRPPSHAATLTSGPGGRPR